jgi:hypothetical protein
VNLEREIGQIKRRLDRIEAVLPDQATEPNTSTPQRGDLYELVNLEVKRSQSSIGPEYAYKLSVRNKGETSTRFGGRIIFLDSSEFEVESQVIEGGVFTVSAGTTFTKTGVAVITDPNHALRIANVTAEVYPI